MSESLLDQTRTLLRTAIDVCGGTPEGANLQSVLDHLDDPLRVAVAGKVKAGKSTLLNALVGEELAPTDAGECTKIVTWYRDGVTYRVTLCPKGGGAERQVPFTRDAGAIDVDLGSSSAEEIDRLEVDWPSAALKKMTLIDTPGIGSLSTEVSARTTSFLAPDDDRVTPADAVLYLMKHLHTTDLDFLAGFHDEEVSQATPVNAIAVLSRADEVAAGRPDSMESARKIANRYRTDKKVRKLVQTVLPVAGLLAVTGETLREAEYAALAKLAAATEPPVEKLLISADRFVNAETPTLTSMERDALLGRLGLFGVRLAVELIRDGSAPNAGALAEQLVAHSGLDDLRRSLLSQFADRRDLLKARSGLLAVEAAARAQPAPQAEALLSELERITAAAHELRELRLLNALRTGAVAPKAADLEEMERLLGTSGTAPATRLGLPPEANEADVRAAAQAALAKWQRRAESPMASPEISDAARILCRTCEGMLTSLG